MKLLSFLLVRRYRRLLTGENWKYSLGGLALFIMFAIYGWAAGLLYNYAFTGASHLSPLLVYRGMGTVLLVLPVISKFFPSVTMKTSYFSPHFPLTKNQLVSIDLFLSILLKPMIVSWTAMTACFLLMAHLPSAADVIRLPLLLLLGLFLAENLVNALFWNKRLYLGVTLAATAIVVWLGVYRDLVGDTCVLLLIGVAFLGLIYYGFYDVNPEQDKTQDRSRRLSWLPAGVFARIGFRNRQYLLVIGMGMFFKAVILVSYGHAMLKAGTATPHLVFVMVFTPLILFTYVYNNVWGYFRSVAMTLSLTDGTLRKYLTGFIRLLLPILTCDALVSFLILLFFHLFSMEYVLIYVCSVVYLFALGVLSSFSRYTEVRKAIELTRLRGNTSLTASFAGLAIVGGFAYSYGHPLYLCIGLGVVVLATVGLWMYIVSNKTMLIARFKSMLFSTP